MSKRTEYEKAYPVLFLQKHKKGIDKQQKNAAKPLENEYIFWRFRPCSLPKT